ncbi:MAG: hypothetical protein HLUCCX10_01450 [Algoriphagus marincola HL-49]|uniref:Uncharacterized protein n=1 Tax=Algoriphagus marincola HL-49 TaxID=1305737 RepID=A0A0N8KHI5_9BACT|nr:MAG: hypothetical protein HLUCCX10_01450 [Algoriphagus marincola HL-49]
MSGIDLLQVAPSGLQFLEFLLLPQIEFGAYTKYTFSAIGISTGIYEKCQRHAL